MISEWSFRDKKPRRRFFPILLLVICAVPFIADGQAKPGDSRPARADISISTQAFSSTAPSVLNDSGAEAERELATVQIQTRTSSG